MTKNERNELRRLAARLVSARSYADDDCCGGNMAMIKNNIGNEINDILKCPEICHTRDGCVCGNSITDGGAAP